MNEKTRRRLLEEILEIVIVSPLKKLEKGLELNGEKFIGSLFSILGIFKSYFYNFKLRRWYWTEIASGLGGPKIELCSRLVIIFLQ